MSMRPKSSRGIWTAMSYGQTSYLGSAIVGFVFGNLLFLLLYLFDDGQVGRPSGYMDQLPTLAACALGSMAAVLAIAAILNYVIGRQIMDGLALQREIYSQADLPLLPRTEPSPYDLGVAAVPESQKQPEPEAA